MSECALIISDGCSPRMRENAPNEAAEVLFKPTICWVVDACKKAGISKICAAITREDEALQEILPQGCEVLVRDKKGFGAALESASEFLQENKNSDVVLLDALSPLADEALLKNALEAHKNQKADLTAVTFCKEENATVQKFVLPEEKNDAKEQEIFVRERISGIAWFCAEFLLNLTNKRKQAVSMGEYVLPDLVSDALLARKLVFAYNYEQESILFRAESRKELLKLNEIARKIIVDRLLENGVNFYCRDGIVIGPDVVIGNDTTIEPGTQLKGAVTIGKECVIGPNTVIVNSTIGDNTTIHSSFIEESQVGNSVRIGPNSHLRPNSVLHDFVKIGNFVEIKNSTLGEKTSVAHLTYIGDSDFGKRINVGCGVVTVNYNGYRKFRSCVEDDAFIGCNTNLISPVTVKKGAYIAAGSTITSDVEEDSLAIARARQCNKEGWVTPYREKELLAKQKKN